MSLDSKYACLCGTRRCVLYERKEGIPAASVLPVPMGGPPPGPGAALPTLIEVGSLLLGFSSFCVQQDATPLQYVMAVVQ